jgi:nitrate/nitrite-specific signal transduction histidine kinase
MKERAQSLGSDLEVDSQAGGGTRIGVQVHIQLHEHGKPKIHTYSGS